jgi:cathepsin A (carboxypeptidase C)
MPISRFTFRGSHTLERAIGLFIVVNLVLLTRNNCRRYAPNIANVIYHKNKELALAPTPQLKKINLASVILANGMTDNYIQMASLPEYLCEGPYPIYDDPNGPECTSLRSKVPTCQRLIKACRDFSSKLTCVPAALYCYQQLYGPVQRTYFSFIVFRTGR